MSPAAPSASPSSPPRSDGTSRSSGSAHLKKVWVRSLVSNEVEFFEVKSQRLRIGRSKDCDIVLHGSYVEPEAVVIQQGPKGWELSVTGSNTVVEAENEEYKYGRRLELKHELWLKIYPYSLMLDFGENRSLSSDDPLGQMDLRLSSLIGQTHFELLDRFKEVARDDQPKAEEVLLVERSIEEMCRLKGMLEPGSETREYLKFIAGRCIHSELITGLISDAKRMTDPSNEDPNNIRKQAESSKNSKEWTKMLTSNPQFEMELSRLIEYIKQKLELDRFGKDLSKKIDEVETQYWTFWEEKCASKVEEKLKEYLALRYVRRQIKDLIYGLGPLEDLLESPVISEIMVVDHKRIYVERNGVLENSGRRFISNRVTETIIEKIVTRAGRKIDKSKPLVDCRLDTGDRVNAVISPIAISGPCLTIRKFPTRSITIDDLVRIGSLTKTTADFLRATVINRRNIIVSGGTGSGKTTLLNCLSNFIPDKERIVTVEDTAELKLMKEHVVQLQTKEGSKEGAEAFTIRDLVKNALRMRPDRVVVGECRGGEALDMLQAMNTGHDGSMTTIHANSSEDAMLRLEVLVQQSDAKLPAISIQRQISSAVDLIIQLNRHHGRRRITQITEVSEVDPDKQCVLTKDIFRLEEYDGEERLSPTGALPSFLPEMLDRKLITLDFFYL